MVFWTESIAFHILPFWLSYSPYLFFQIIAHNRKPSIYKEQLKAEKLATAKEKKATAAAAKKAMKENKAKILKAIQESGKSPEEILALLSSSNNSNEPQPQENQEEW